MTPRAYRAAVVAVAIESKCKKTPEIDGLGLLCSRGVRSSPVPPASVERLGQQAEIACVLDLLSSPTASRVLAGPWEANGLNQWAPGPLGVDAPAPGRLR